MLGNGIVLVCGLQAVAPCREALVCTKLCGEASQHCAAQFPRIFGHILANAARAYPVLASCGPAALAVETLTLPRKGVQYLGRIRHEAGGLLHWPSFSRAMRSDCSELALVSADDLDTVDPLELGHAFQLPRRGIARVLV